MTKYIYILHITNYTLLVRLYYSKKIKSLTSVAKVLSIRRYDPSLTLLGQFVENILKTKKI